MNPLNNQNVPFNSLPPDLMNNINQIKGLMQYCNAMSNPQMFLQQLMQQNPMMNQVMQMCNGQNPKDIFMQMCQQKGVDPNQIISMLSK